MFDFIILLVFCKDTNFCTLRVVLDIAYSKIIISSLLQRVLSDRSVAFQLSSDKYWGAVDGFHWILKQIFFLIKTVNIILIIVIRFFVLLPILMRSWR
jgi:hypothetical protein